MAERVMKVHEQIEALRDPNVSFETLSNRAGGTPSPQIFARYSRASTLWRNAMEPPSVLGYSHALGITVRSAWLSNGASLGLDVGDEESEFFAHRPVGLQRLKRRHVLHLREAATQCVADADREDELAQVKAENERLRQELEAARGSKRTQARPTTT